MTPSQPSPMVQSKTAVVDAAARNALLAICANPDGDHGEGLRRLGDECSGQLVEYAIATRTAPLVARAIRSAGLADYSPVLQSVTEAIAPIASAHALGALGQGHAAARTIGLLENEGLSPIALKGLSLAFRDYPDPALRPMRDLDLLLEPDDAVLAERLLLEHSEFRRRKGVARYGLDYGHQLPEIEHIPSGLVIELHHRINARGWKSEPEFLDMLRGSAQGFDLLGQPVRIPDIQSNFLHLVEHATLHHLFANGPLVFADLHYLAKSSRLDWQRLQHTASSLGLGKGLKLLAHIADHHGANWVPSEWVQNARIDDTIAVAARQALFEPAGISQQVAMANRMQGADGGPVTIGTALARAFRPSPNQLSRLSGHHANSIWRWLGYPAWLLEKGRNYLAIRSKPEISDAAADRRDLKLWLGGT